MNTHINYLRHSQSINLRSSENDALGLSLGDDVITVGPGEFDDGVALNLNEGSVQ
jgi:hypothetical protein